MDFSSVDSFVSDHVGRTFPAAQVEVRVRGDAIHSQAFGVLDPEAQSQNRVTAATLFDLASLSKLFTATTMMVLVEAGLVALDQPVCALLPEFVASEHISFRNLLAHNSGLPPCLPLWKMEKPEERRSAVLHSELAYPTGSRVVYSDVGFILLGFAIEHVTGQPLNRVVYEKVTQPLGLTSLQYGPAPKELAAPTEYSDHHRRRMCGEVHDENAWSLGGIAGHAGLFGCARDIAAFGRMFLNRGAPLLRPETVAEMTRLQSEDGAVRRGVGFALSSPDPEAASHPLSRSSFGHLGFTGTSLWMDPDRELVVACLTNRVYYGRDNAEAMGRFRADLHRLVCRIIDGRGE